jgi:hypothetical protein
MNVFTQVECSVHYNKNNWQDQHNEEWNRNLVLLQKCRYSSQVRLEINRSFTNIIISVD